MKEKSIKYPPILWDHDICYVYGVKYDFSNYDLCFHPMKVRDVIYKVYGGRCYYTGDAITNKRYLNIDHIIPKQLKGHDHLFNYVPTSRYYNANKKDKLLPEKQLHLALRAAIKNTKSIVDEFLKENPGWLASKKELRKRRFLIGEMVKSNNIDKHTILRLAKFFNCSHSVIRHDFDIVCENRELLQWRISNGLETKWWQKRGCR